MKTVLFLTGIMLASSAHAQTKCKPQEGGKLHCYYSFGIDYEGGFMGWENVIPLGVNEVASMAGEGHIVTRADSPYIFDGNNTHLTWTDAGAGFDWVRARMFFPGDAGVPGWYPKLTDGSRHCDARGHATRASDEMVLLTLGDDGESYVGGVMGGDLEALGVTLPPLEGDPRTYAVIAAVQKVAGETVPRVLAWTIGPPISKLDPIHDKNLTVSVFEDGQGGWIVRAKGDEWNIENQHGGRQWQVDGRIEGEPNFEAGVGLGSIVIPQTRCLPDLARTLKLVGEVEARFP